MNILELKQAFKQGKLDKHSYIEQMYREFHGPLFDYVRLLQETAVEKLEITREGIIASFREFGIKMYVREKDQRLAPWEALNFDSFESLETKKFLELTSDSDTILDIGANFGYYSLVLSHMRPKSNIHAFEPLPQTYEFLTRNLKLNNVKNVVAHPFGFADVEKDVNIYFYDEGSGNTSLVDLSKRENVQSERIQLQTLDAFVERQKLKVNFIKCDVEGAEFMVIKGGMRTIKEQRPILFLELLRKWSAPFGYHPQEVVETLAKLNYHCFAVGGEELEKISEIDEQTQATNFFFVPASK